jgi:hypothetical protein
MRLDLARFGFRGGAAGLPTWLPRRLVAVDRARERHEFRIRVRLDGRVAVVRGAAGRAGPFVLAVDPMLVYRRRAAFVPPAAADMQQMAAGLFPFDRETTAYAAASETEVFAVPRAELTALGDGLGEPQAVLVAPPTAPELTAALAGRLRRGEAADLSNHPRRLANPAALITAGLVVALAGVIWGVAAAATARDDSRLAELRQQLRQIEANAGPLIQRRETIARMSVAMDETDRLEQSQRRLAIEMVGRLLVAVPPGAFIEKVEYAEQRIVLTGFGNEPLQWLGPFGVKPEDVIITKMPATDRFTARVKITS